MIQVPQEITLNELLECKGNYMFFQIIFIHWKKLIWKWIRNSVLNRIIKITSWNQHGILRIHVT